MMKLIYFDARGRAEPARLMLEMVGAEYTYEGISLEAWMTQGAKERMQERTPLGQLPLLEDGPVVLSQSQAILRYLARKLGLYGSTDEQQRRIDEVAETANDIILDAALLHWAPNFHERRAEHREATAKKLGLLTRYFMRMRKDPERWIDPARYTLADVNMAYALETLLPLHPGLLAGYPELHHAMTTFFHSSGVRAYVRSDRRCRTWTVSMATFAGKPEETHHWTE